MSEFQDKLNAILSSPEAMEQISAIAFQAPHALHMDKEFALLQEAALQAFRQEYPNREHFLKK